MSPKQWALVVVCTACLMWESGPQNRYQRFSFRGRIMMVELDMFSGQPNPTWQLSPDEDAELQKKISTLGPSVNSIDTFDGLGYRGLIVRSPNDPESWLKVGLGKIAVVQGKKESVYHDQGRTIERWLLSTAKGKINDRLIGAAGLGIGDSSALQ